MEIKGDTDEKENKYCFNDDSFYCSSFATYGYGDQ